MAWALIAPKRGANGAMNLRHEGGGDDRDYLVTLAHGEEPRPGHSEE